MNDNQSPINVDVNISAKADLAPIIRATPKGLKCLSFLLFGKRKANIERYIKLSKAQTDIDEKGIIEGKLIFNPKEETLRSTSQGLKQQIVGTTQDEEVQNLIACSIKAAENIKDGETEKEPSQDFINRWRNDAKQIHSEELQNIWGRLMAEEINAPNSISLRTLDMVKNISKEEAELFVSCLKYVVKNMGFISIKDWDETEELLYREQKDLRRYTNPNEENLTKQSNNLIKLYNAGFISNKSSKNAAMSEWIYKEVKDQHVYSVQTTNYLFYVMSQQGEARHSPYIQYFKLSEFAVNIYQLLCNDENIRNANRQDAIDFIEVIRPALLDCGANHVYFGYIEDNGQVLEYEKYSL